MAGHSSVRPDNVKVLKGGDEKVHADVWGAFLCPWSVHSNPCPAGPARPSAMTAVLSHDVGRWMTYIHPLSPSGHLAVSATLVTGSMLRQLKAAQGHAVSLDVFKRKA